MLRKTKIRRRPSIQRAWIATAQQAEADLDSPAEWRHDGGACLILQTHYQHLGRAFSRPALYSECLPGIQGHRLHASACSVPPDLNPSEAEQHQVARQSCLHCKKRPRGHHPSSCFIKSVADPVYWTSNLSREMLRDVLLTILHKYQAWYPQGRLLTSGLSRGSTLE